MTLSPIARTFTTTKLLPNKQLVTDGHCPGPRFAGRFAFGARSFPFGDERRLSYAVEASGRGTIAGRCADLARLPVDFFRQSAVAFIVWKTARALGVVRVHNVFLRELSRAMSWTGNCSNWLDSSDCGLRPLSQIAPRLCSRPRESLDCIDVTSTLSS